MFTWDLPQALEVGGRMYEIRTDFRPALDILEAFNDPELPEENKIQVMMEILFVELPPEEYLNEAVERAYWYLDCGKRSDGKAGPRVMDWEQDASMIFSAINKVAVAFLVSGLLFVMQIKKLLSEMEKGEVLCTN